MYAKICLQDRFGRKLKQHHHVMLDPEFINDCKVWILFLSENQINMCRPFLDLSDSLNAKVLDFYTDSSGNGNLGCGGIFGSEYFFSKWEPEFVKRFRPSIEYLELFAVCAGLLIWSRKLQNSRVIVFCDNESVCSMVNNTTSGCKNCMVLMRILVLNGLRHNFRTFARHVSSSKNKFADLLSRQRFRSFWKEAKKEGRKFKLQPEAMPEEIWPMSRIWKY